MAKYDIFISYSRKDLALAQPLVKELKAMGMKVWFDMNGIESGDEFDEKIISAIDDSDSVMFMYSENSIQSEWTKKEVQYAKRQGKTIRPVLISGSMPTTGWFTFHYGSIDCIDLTNHIQKEKMIDNLRSCYHLSIEEFEKAKREKERIEREQAEREAKRNEVKRNTTKAPLSATDVSATKKEGEDDGEIEIPTDSSEQSSGGSVKGNDTFSNKGMFKRPFSFKGRIRRLEFCFSYLIFCIWTYVFLGLMDSNEPSLAASLLFIISFTPMFWFLFAQAAKRCHDRGNSGWYQIIPFYFLWMLFVDGETFSNDYGDSPKG